jgi:hypothetical protein
MFHKVSENIFEMFQQMNCSMMCFRSKVPEFIPRTSRCTLYIISIKNLLRCCHVAMTAVGDVFPEQSEAVVMETLALPETLKTHLPLTVMSM